MLIISINLDLFLLVDRRVELLADPFGWVFSSVAELILPGKGQSNTLPWHLTNMTRPAVALAAMRLGSIKIPGKLPVSNKISWSLQEGVEEVEEVDVWLLACHAESAGLFCVSRLNEPALLSVGLAIGARVCVRAVPIQDFAFHAADVEAVLLHPFPLLAI